MYDFMVFGYFAAAIGQAYFPAGDEFGTLLKSLGDVRGRFLMRRSARSSSGRSPTAMAGVPGCC